jgi:hypothetical protein
VVDLPDMVAGKGLERTLSRFDRRGRSQGWRTTAEKQALRRRARSAVAEARARDEIILVRRKQRTRPGVWQERVIERLEQA